MITTLHDGDRVLVNKLSYRLHDPNRGDVVVLKTIEGVGERDLIKRVDRACPARRSRCANCRCSSTASVLDEPYLDPTVVTPGNVRRRLRRRPSVARRPGVRDGRQPRRLAGQPRQLGPIDYDDIVGRAFVVIWPQRRLAVAVDDRGVDGCGGAELGAVGVDHRSTQSL